MKVLIVDDSPEALLIAEARLAKESLTILCASGGRAGMETARREKPDLILLDIDMPDISGIEVCKQIKSDADLCMIPVIFLSGAGSAEDKVRGLDVGAVDYISKPFDAFELRARVRAALRTKHLQDLLIEYAHIDPLTGLPNRRALMERLAQEWARIQRRGGQLSFIMADIDHFKLVNDTYGHNIGDRMLQAVAGVIQTECRRQDLATRYGGEEFGIVVPDETAQTAAKLAERCRRAIEQVRVMVRGEAVRATASLGVADAAGAASPEDLVKHADAMLYRAKTAGRNAVCVEGGVCPVHAD
jgi:diguanylate cyclase (GGDEF)-like protein